MAMEGGIVDDSQQDSENERNIDGDKLQKKKGDTKYKTQNKGRINAFSRAT